MFYEDQRGFIVPPGIYFKVNSGNSSKLTMETTEEFVRSVQN